MSGHCRFVHDLRSIEVVRAPAAEVTIRRLVDGVARGPLYGLMGMVSGTSDDPEMQYDEGDGATQFAQLGTMAGHLMDPRLWFVAYHAEDPVGYVFVSLDMRDRATIMTVGVHPDRRRAGLGRWLLSHALVQTREARARLVQASIHARNVASIRLHQACGFRRTY